MGTLLTAAASEEAVEEVAREMDRISSFVNGNVEGLLQFAWRVVLCFVLFWIGSKAIKWVRKVIRKILERSSVDVGVVQFTDSMIKGGLYALLVFTIAVKLGVESSSVAALIASGGVAIGLALQGSLSNFAGGVLILLLKPFVVGDYIIEDSHGNEGTVKEIQIFYTKLSTVDNRIIVIPNGTLANTSLTNVTAKEMRRLELHVDISYEADLKKAKELMRSIFEREEGIIKSEEIKVYVDQLGESSVVLGARAWVKTEEYWDIRWRLLEEIKLSMDANGIEIPYRQVTVHMAEKESLQKNPR